jgi:hypothetical protein
MIYNGFRRIALAHSLLPATQAAEASQQAEDRDESMLGPLEHVPPDPADVSCPTGTLESVCQ